MQNYIKIIIIFISFMFITLDVDAAGACPNSKYKEMGQLASYVTVNYDIEDKSETKTLTIGEDSTTYKIPKYTFIITIYNLTENLYAVIENETKETSTTIRYEDTNSGVYAFEDYDIGTVYNYKIYIYSNDDECTGTFLRSIRVTKPKYNAYSEYKYCENSSSYYCQRFITTDLNIDNTAEFLSKIEVNNEKNNPKKEQIQTQEEIKGLLKDNWKIYLLIFGGIALVTTGVIFYIKRANKKSGWKL